MEQWLDPAAGEDALKSMIVPTDGEGLEWYPVSAEVGQVRHDHEGLLKRDETHGKPLNRSLICSRYQSQSLRGDGRHRHARASMRPHRETVSMPHPYQP